MKFKHTMGIELTAIPKVPFDMMLSVDHNGQSYSYTDVDLTQHQKILRGVKKALGRYVGCIHIDSHCLEVSSPVFKDSVRMKRWFTKVRNTTKKHGMTPHHEDTVCGGGHIHVGINYENPLQKKICSSIRRDYFLPWVFSQPDEEESCDNGGTGKNASMHQNYKTIEFRFFESAKSWREQWDHVVFVNKYIDLVERSEDPGRKFNRYPYSREQLNKISQKQAIKSFKALLTKLELPYSRYEKYVTRNLLPRWELERVRR